MFWKRKSLIESKDAETHPVETRESCIEVTFDLHEEKPPSVTLANEIEINIEKTASDNDVFADTDTSGGTKEPDTECNMDLLNQSGNLDESKLSTTSSSSPATTTLTMASFLCIKVNKNKDYINCPLNRKMKNRIESEFWFQINDTG